MSPSSGKKQGAQLGWKEVHRLLAELCHGSSGGFAWAAAPQRRVVISGNWASSTFLVCAEEEEEEAPHGGRALLKRSGCPQAIGVCGAMCKFALQHAWGVQS